MTKKVAFLSFLFGLSIFFSACEKEKYIDDKGNLLPKTVEFDSSLPAINVNGSLLHAEAFGPPDSNLIICIHGGPGSDYRYMLNAKDLTNYGYRVVFYDQIGAGLSQRFPKEYYTNKGASALDELVYKELSSVIDYYKINPKQKVYLIGDSWGGMLASAYAGKYPNQINGLIVCEPGGLVWKDVKAYVTRSRSFKLWGETFNDATYLDQFISGRENQHEVLDYKAVIIANTNNLINEEPSLFWRAGAVTNAALFEIGEKYEPDFSIGLANFDPKVLYFHSELNIAHPIEWAKKVSSAYKNVELFTVTGIGHSGFITNTKAWKQQTLPKIITYLKSL